MKKILASAGTLLVILVGVMLLLNSTLIDTKNNKGKEQNNPKVEQEEKVEEKAKEKVEQTGKTTTTTEETSKEDSKSVESVKEGQENKETEQEKVEEKVEENKSRTVVEKPVHKTVKVTGEKQVRGVTLNVRDGAGTSGTKVIKTVAPNTVLKVSQSTKVGNITWYYTDTVKGWVSGYYLTDVVKEASKPVKAEGKKPVTAQTTKATPTPKQPTKATSAPSNAVDSTQMGQAYSGSKLKPTTTLNIRNKPGTSGTSVIGKAQSGKFYTFTRQSKQGTITWYYSPELKGWVSGYYLTDGKTVTTKPTPTQKPQATNKKYKPMHIYYGNKAIPYKNSGQSGGQATIDKTNNASTWGGASVFSGLDGKNTHLIGHNGGRNQFGGMHTQSVFIVTDAQGRAFRYVKTTMYVVNEYGVRVSDGKNMWDRIVGTGGGERITLQSTKKHPLKYIVEAKFDKQIQ